MANSAKMAEMAINRQNRQTINKNSNEMAKGPFCKVAISAKMAYLARMAEMALNRQTVNKNSNEMAKGPFGSGDFGENGVFGENGRNGA